MQKDTANRTLTLAVRQGIMSPEEAFRQLNDADALEGLSLEDLKAMPKKKKTHIKKTLSRLFFIPQAQDKKHLSREAILPARPFEKLDEVDESAHQIA